MPNNTRSGQPRVMRTPEELQERWRDKHAAYLSDIALPGHGIRVKTVSNEESLAQLHIYNLPQRSKRANGKWNNHWRATEAEGAVAHLRAQTITLDGIPAESTPYYGDSRHGVIRPYPDILFIGGLVTVELVDDGPPRSAFSIGPLVELAIVDPNWTSELQVWPAQTI
jgi:hypothetical protein